MADKLTFDVTARRVDAHGSVGSTKDATITLDTELAGRRDALQKSRPKVTLRSPRSSQAESTRFFTA